MFQITNRADPSETIILAGGNYPEWVYEQTDTESATELHSMLDDCYSIFSYFDGSRYIGADNCGIGLTPDTIADYLADQAS